MTGMYKLTRTELKHLSMLARHAMEDMHAEGGAMGEHFADFYQTLSMRLQNIANSDTKRIMIEK